MSTARDYRVILGEAIREQRIRAGLTIEVLAEKADLHPNYLGRVERGEEHASVSALIRVAKALGIRVRELFVNV